VEVLVDVLPEESSAIEDGAAANIIISNMMNEKMWSCFMSHKFFSKVT
jgi:hypothetical protein